MTNWLDQDDFDKTEYGKLNLKLDGKKYFGRLDKFELPLGSRIVPDPKNGNFGIVVNDQGEPVAKVDLPYTG